MRSPKLKLCHKPSLIDELCDEAKWKNGPCRWVTAKETENLEAVNVEAHRRNPSSHLHWLRNILQVRKQFPVFGTGTFDLVPCANPSILAYVRSPQPQSDPAPRPRRTGRSRRGAGANRSDGSDNPVLCVHNLSRLGQPAELHVERWVGRQPIELLGRVAFPLIGTDPYPVTLASYGSLCFELA